MLIRELVERSGLSKDTIRFYERKGLVALAKNSRRPNNYKEYSEQVLNKLLLIRRVKDLGFTLGEIDTFLGHWNGKDASCENLKVTLEDKMIAIDEELVKLTALKSRLAASLENCNNNNCEFERTVPACICK